MTQPAQFSRTAGHEAARAELRRQRNRYREALEAIAEDRVPGVRSVQTVVQAYAQGVLSRGESDQIRHCPIHGDTYEARCGASLGSDGQGPVFCQRATEPGSSAPREERA